MNKTFAVIIAAYGCPEYIMDCYRSVAVQKRVQGWDYDIRIGVDGCVDTHAVLSGKGVPFYWNEQNHGAFLMRNALIYAGKADIYGYFDADDMMKKNYIAENIKELKNYQACISAKINCDKNMRPLTSPPVAKIETGGAMSFTHRALESVGGYYRHRCAGDTDLMERLRMAGHEIKEIPDGLYYRRRHNKALTKSGLTVYGGPYRKRVWAEMTAKREQGIFKIQPTIINLEKIS